MATQSGSSDALSRPPKAVSQVGRRTGESTRVLEVFAALTLQSSPVTACFMALRVLNGVSDGPWSHDSVLDIGATAGIFEVIEAVLLQ